MSKKVLFLHPDLGIGGAERLVVDAALALISTGHSVNIVTTHHDMSHCFAETKNGTFPVTVVGNWIPRSIFGKCYALCAYLRMIYAALFVACFSNMNPDLVFCDIVSACIPVFKLFKIPVLYYCHFPDQLLSVPGSKLKELYRAPLNWLEEKTTGSADIILVNSQFTRNIFKQTFKTLGKTPQILYPSINTDFFNQECSITLKDVGLFEHDLNDERFIFLSINRYERKKNIALAISSLSALKHFLSAEQWKNVHLIIAGGYDCRVLENVEYYEELVEETKTCQVEDKVHFLKSPSDMVKLCLLKQSSCLLYTPSNEHFGIVPLEAMFSYKPVIAVNSGGPTETIESGVTGFLCHPTKEEFSSAMAKCIQNVDLAKRLGAAGRKRFEEKFSFDAFRDGLNSVITSFPVEEKNHTD